MRNIIISENASRVVVDNGANVWMITSGLGERRDRFSRIRFRTRGADAPQKRMHFHYFGFRDGKNAGQGGWRNAEICFSYYKGRVLISDTQTRRIYRHKLYSDGTFEGFLQIHGKFGLNLTYSWSFFFISYFLTIYTTLRSAQKDTTKKSKR